MHTENKWRVAVSTDIATGFPFHHPAKAVEIYEASGLKDFGVELVPIFIGTLVLAHASINGNELSKGLRLEGVHGRMGSLPSMFDHGKGVFDFAKIKLLDLTLPYFHPSFGINLNSIAEKQGRDIYHNVHHELLAYSEKMFKHYLDRFKDLHNVLLAIENGPTNGGVDLTHDLVARYRDNELNAVATIDVLHAALEFNDYNDSLAGIEKVWGKVLNSIGDDTRQVHLPIGKVDNLPIAQMLIERKMIQDLVAVLKDSKVEVVTFENQHSYFTGIWKSERDRLSQIIPVLVGLGLINEGQYSPRV